MADPRNREMEDLLRRDGPTTAAALARSLAVSQPTISRLLAQAGGRIVRIGRARASRYALSRDIARAGSRWPLYRIDPLGSSMLLGELRALHGDGFHLESAHPLPAFVHGDFADGLFPGLPWFLDDQRPQGFLGRAFVRRVAGDIGAPDDLARWRADDVILALLRHGEDEPGDLVLGEAALQRAMQSMLSPGTIPSAARSTRYPDLAESALAGEDVGSSAGGEQPKFTTVINEDGRFKAVIVKFSERALSPAAERWADLLRCEHWAGEALRSHGLTSAQSEILQAGGRTFLQSERFDRTATLGRRGLISLAALDAAYYGHGRIDWWKFAPQLHRDGWLGADDARVLAIRGWFGALIGNSDMHLGNTSLGLADTRPLELAPSYDMLPMLFRPNAQGEIVPRSFEAPAPPPEYRAQWRHAAPIAMAFWQQVAHDDFITPGFRLIARQALAALEKAIDRFG